jgi:hypothetical protein
VIEQDGELGSEFISKIWPRLGYYI